MGLVIEFSQRSVVPAAICHPQQAGLDDKWRALSHIEHRAAGSAFLNSKDLAKLQQASPYAQGIQADRIEPPDAIGNAPALVPRREQYETIDVFCPFAGWRFAALFRDR